MKLLKKILPVASLPVVAAMPFATSSCSNVYIDLLAKLYVPDGVTPLAACEGTGYELEDAYYGYFKDHKDLLDDDALWGTSIYGRTYYNQQLPLSKFETLLSHIYSFDMIETETGTHRLSYKMKNQAQVRDDTDLSGKKSYAVNTYDVYFEINNIECYPTYLGECYDESSGRGKDNPWQMWMICPNKYNIERGRWYQELQGDESIKFEIKAVYKGYSETGAQNYIKEINESAIIDEEHKYTPELKDIYTEMMLITPYYLSNVKPRVWINEDEGLSPITKSGSTYTCTADFNFGENTVQTSSGDTVKISFNPATYIYSPTGATGSVKTLTSPNNITVANKQTATLNFEFSGEVAAGDIVYFEVTLTHEATSKSPKWVEWFPVSTVIKSL